ncbi:hypothetical protein GA0074695_5907 [Micromonospora viridifaciens]|uniref:Uncharacterized protein n=1 Tax=Micromonospora viridifaciens TaxID=1881 RepID=A0A1C4ZPN1_MICVI|nr:hypothetical protein [Micromonospora viridifaciens]SCF34938.1 hypothetical protein GA0074695_5907 [Micromonospora viridifaciens]
MRDLTPDERQEMRWQLRTIAIGWAQRLEEPQPDARHRADDEPSHPERMQTHLARMVVGEQMRGLLADLVSASAEEAVQYGAGYPELGAAVGTSRQAARKRWPYLPVAKRRAAEWKQPPGGIGWAGESHLGYPGA